MSSWVISAARVAFSIRIAGSHTPLPRAVRYCHGGASRQLGSLGPGLRLKPRSNAPSSRCFLPRVPTAACNSLVGETDPAGRARY
eukprot:scaffold76882_cov71-Phaeocystis_antarctica.AAC.1